jgi:hypothetical protein
MYADEASPRCPGERILLETRAVNTAENVRFTRELLCAAAALPATSCGPDQWSAAS